VLDRFERDGVQFHALRTWQAGSRAFTHLEPAEDPRSFDDTKPDRADVPRGGPTDAGERGHRIGA